MSALAAFLKSWVIAKSQVQNDAKNPKITAVEIIQLILNNLSDEKKSLAQCSLVCRAWQLPSQDFLFSKKEILLGFAPLHKNLADLLKKSPHLESMIRNVMFCLDEKNDDPLKFLPMFRRLESITLTTWTKAYQDPQALSPYLENQLQHLPKPSSLRVLKLHAINLRVTSTDNSFFDVLKDCVTLQSIELWRVKIDDPRDLLLSFTTPIDRPRIPIKKLAVLDSLIKPSIENEEKLHWILSPFNFDHLTNLNFSHGQFFLHGVVQNAPRLEQLIISKPDQDRSKYMVDLSNCKALRSLVIELVSPGIQADYHHLPKWLIPMLASLPVPNDLRRLQIVSLPYQNFPSGMFRCPRITWPKEWACMAEQLTKERLPNLEILKLSTVGDTIAYSDGVWTIEAFGQAMEDGIRLFFAPNPPPFNIETYIGHKQEVGDDYNVLY